MNKYNRSLDFLALAIAKARQGNPVMAAKLFSKAVGAPDVVRAQAILEVSNKQAYEAQAAAKVEAAAKAKKLAASKAKPAKVEADFDIGDDADIEGLVGEGDDMGVDEPGAEDVDAAVEDEDEDGDFDEQFAKVLSSMERKTKPRK